MRYLTREDAALLKRLVQLAGSPLLVEQALQELSREGTQPPTREAVVEYILKHRDEWHRARCARQAEEHRPAPV